VEALEQSPPAPPPPPQQQQQQRLQGADLLRSVLRARAAMQEAVKRTHAVTIPVPTHLCDLYPIPLPLDEAALFSPLSLRPTPAELPPARGAVSFAHPPALAARLAERREDIKQLTWHFIARENERNNLRVRAIDDDVWAVLEGYDWQKNNVRELERVIERIMVWVDDSDRITMEIVSRSRALPDEVLRSVGVPPDAESSVRQVVTGGTRGIDPGGDGQRLIRGDMQEGVVALVGGGDLFQAGPRESDRGDLPGGDLGAQGRGVEADDI
jgi:hypothetical protein